MRVDIAGVSALFEQATHAKKKKQTSSWHPFHSHGTSHRELRDRKMERTSWIRTLPRSVLLHRADTQQEDQDVLVHPDFASQKTCRHDHEDRGMTHGHVNVRHC